MKIYLLTFILIISIPLLFSLNSFATNYYVSSEGDDSRSGTSAVDAWKSLKRLNNLVPKPGDSIFFRRGDEWNGTVTVNMFGKEGSPVVYGAYGEGERPKIYGSEIIPGWKKHSGNIYKARFDQKINQLFLEGKKMTAARYPNSGYLFITSSSNPTSLTAEELPDAIDYSGAKWFGRTNYFTTSLLEVKSSHNKVLVINEAPRFPLKKGLGFFLMNKLEFLDQPGEWFYDEESKMVYLWTPGGDSPENYIIRGSVYNDGLYVSGKNYITIRDIHFLHQAEKGIHLKNSNYLVIDNNAFSYSDGYGIYSLTEATDLVITNNHVTGVNHYGMYLRISNSLISNNKLSEIALLENIGITGTGEDNFGGGIYVAGEKGKNKITYNRLEKIGSTGILFARPENKIECNFIKDVGLLKSDMGGIYTSWYKKSASQGPEGSTIRNNIILNVVGEKYGYTSTRNMGEGIYIDESATGVIIENNTIAHCSNSGIKLHKTENITVNNNTIFDTRQSIHVLKSEGTEENQITNNILIAVSDNDDYLKRQVLINESEGNAFYDYNEYIHLYENKEIFFNGSDYYTFNKWQSSNRNEINSRALTTLLLPGEKELLLYNDSPQEKTINLKGKDLKDIRGEKITGDIRLQPYTSVILIGYSAGNLIN